MNSASETHLSQISVTEAPYVVFEPRTSSLLQNSTDSLPYTWHDEYLDESPGAMRTRWIEKQTFGPVLQSEFGSFSVVTPSAPRRRGQEDPWAVLDTRGGVPKRNAPTGLLSSTASTVCVATVRPNVKIKAINKDLEAEAAAPNARRHTLQPNQLPKSPVEETPDRQRQLSRSESLRQPQRGRALKPIYDDD